MKTKVKVWDTQGKYIGDFEVPEDKPEFVQFAGKLYKHNDSYGVFIEMGKQPFIVPSLWTTNVK